MEGLKYCDSGGVSSPVRAPDDSMQPSMGDLIRSMREHLMTPALDQLDPEPIANMSARENHTRGLSEANLAKHDSYCHRTASDSPGYTCATRSDSFRILPGGRRNSMQSDACGEEEEVEVDITSAHPRLQGEFYRQLRLKYPRVFLRRCSVSSDAASTVSSIINYKPAAYVDSDLESNVSNSSRRYSADVNGFNPMRPLPPHTQSHKQLSKEASSMSLQNQPRKRLQSVGSEVSDDDMMLDSASVLSINSITGHRTSLDQLGKLHRSHDQNGRTDKSHGQNISEKGHVTDHMRKSKRSSDQNSLTERSHDHRRSDRSLKFHSPRGPSERAINGILKKECITLPTSSADSESIASLKEKLRKNQETLHRLFAMENNPFRIKQSTDFNHNKPTDLQAKTQLTKVHTDLERSSEISELSQKPASPKGLLLDASSSQDESIMSQSTGQPKPASPRAIPLQLDLQDCSESSSQQSSNNSSTLSFNEDVLNHTNLADQGFKSSANQHNNVDEYYFDSSTYTKRKHKDSSSRPSRLPDANKTEKTPPVIVQKPPPPSSRPPRKPEDQRRSRNPVAKRYESPDSQHDSAIDADTSSQQSSPSSGSHITERRSRSQTRGQDQIIKGTQRSRTPKLGRYKSQEKLSGPREAQPSKHTESDEDSGIMATTRSSSATGRLRRDSNTSSLDTDHETDLHRPVMPASQITLISKSKGKSRPEVQGQGSMKCGPVRGDHGIQGISPRSLQSEEEVEGWLAKYRGEPRRSASVADITATQHSAGHATRVHFEDEVYRVPKRTMSYPELHEIDSVDHINAMRGYLLPSTAYHMVRSKALSQSQEVLYDRLGHDTFNQSQQVLQHRMHNNQSSSSLQLLNSVTTGYIPYPYSTYNGTISQSEQTLQDRITQLHKNLEHPLSHTSSTLSLGDLHVESDCLTPRGSSIVLPPEDFQDPQPSSNHSYNPVTPHALHKQHTSVVDDIDYSNQIYNELNAALQKKSKKPWKRNKCSFMPSTESVSSSPVKTKKAKEQAALKPPSGKAPKRSTPDVYKEVSEEHTKNKISLDHTYEEVDFMRGLSHNSKNGYATVNINKKSSNRTNNDVSNNCTVHNFDDSITQAPDLPTRGYRPTISSNLENSKNLSGSRSSLVDKVAGMRDSARKKLSRFRRAISLDRLDKAGSDHDNSSVKAMKFRRAPSIRSIAERLSFRGRKESNRQLPYDIGEPVTQNPDHLVIHSSDLPGMDTVTDPTHFRPIGKLLQLNPDGTQILELSKPPSGPYGFYIARGNAKYNYGVFISRLSDGLPEHFFSGLLSIGDEIIEVNKRAVRDIPLNTVYDWIAESTTLVLKVLPYLMRAES